nr:hypothetical protein [Tanacetum cinerariifolium]
MSVKARVFDYIDYLLMTGRELEELSYKELDNLETELHDGVLALKNQKMYVTEPERQFEELLLQYPPLFVLKASTYHHNYLCRNEFKREGAGAGRSNLEQFWIMEIEEVFADTEMLSDSDFRMAQNLDYRFGFEGFAQAVVSLFLMLPKKVRLYGNAIQANIGQPLDRPDVPSTQTLQNTKRNCHTVSANSLPNTKAEVGRGKVGTCDVPLLPKHSNSYGYFETASHLSLDAVGDIQMASLEPDLESSSIFILISYLVRFLPRLSPNHVARGAGFVWERVVEVMGSSGGSGGVVRSGEEGSCRFGGKDGMCTVFFKRGGKTG